MSEESLKQLRLDQRIIVELIEPKSRVIDLGCGDGALLAHLIEHKQCHGTGVEIDEKAIYQCMEKGLTVSHIDIDTGLSDYSSKRFDYVILSETLQQVLHPKEVLFEALRVGKKVIVVIPNLCHFPARLQLFFQGKAPITKELPYEWYNSPNLRFFSLKDFKHFCRDHKIKILEEVGVANNRRVYIRPNLFANAGLYLLEQ